MRSFLNLLGRFGADERGVFGVIFAVMAIAIVAFGGAVVDYVSVQQAKTRAQVALDAAALALQPKIYTQDEETIRASAERLLIERIGDATIAAQVTAASFDQIAGTLDLTADVTVQTNFVRLVGINSLTAGLLSEATRGATNIEVALALDTTGSMAGNKIVALRKATNELIDIIVKDVQDPTYSKLALVPYAATVNPGIYADAARGTIPAGLPITGVAWAARAGTNITAITKGTQTTITSANHGLNTGDYVWVDDVAGMTTLNEKIYRVSKKDNNSFMLLTTANANINSSSYSNYSSGGTVTACKSSGCEVNVTTQNAHGFSTGDYVRIVGTGGTTSVNNTTYQVTSQGASSFSLNGTTPNTLILNNPTPPSKATYRTYTSGGNAYCTKLGCEYYYFLKANNSYDTYQVSSCVTERKSYNTTDEGPSLARLGYNYPSSTAPCVSVPITPLTTNKTDLHATANALPASGATAGHLGLAWAWYMVSPNFASMLPEESKPGSYDADNLRKFVILMTDGAFNTMYCDGVLSKDSSNGGTSVKNSCNAPSGDSWTQATRLCTEMKKHVTVFTVGFDIDNDVSTQNRMKACATTENHFFLASNETQLLAAFRNIAETISALRVSR